MHITCHIILAKLNIITQVLERSGYVIFKSNKY
jgi:hypothetical protein